MKTGAAAVALLFALAGCGDDEAIRVYTAPKEPRWRMLAALVPAGGATWFFKVVAASAAAGARKDEIERFFAGLKVEGGDVHWTLPEGWREEKGSGDRVATLRAGPLELAVTKLGGPAGGVLANVNRWRGQLGLGPIGEAELASTARRVDLGGGVQATLVDLEGSKKPATGGPMGGGMRPAAPPEAPAEEPGPSLEDVRELLTYNLPSGWREKPPPPGPRLFEFQAGPASVSVSFLQGNAGGLGPNINRWRGQVGLEPLDKEAAAGSARPFEFLGDRGYAVDLVGPERAMLCVFVLGPPISLFVKMEGPKEPVLQEKPAFEAFSRSLRRGSR